MGPNQNNSVSSCRSSALSSCSYHLRRSYRNNRLVILLLVAVLSAALFLPSLAQNPNVPTYSQQPQAPPPPMEGVRVVSDKQQRHTGEHGGAPRRPEGKGQERGGGPVGHAVSAEEFEDYKRDFVEFDLNHDGLIDAFELRAAFEQDKVEPEELYQFFMDVDTDSSGTVTEIEYMEYAMNFHT
eukprot:GHVS01064808.1.p1 GENE.GHVS01064808.1~~GHVS01064808.1.p1  ORF type:complete len:183 (+),score=29.35 GHVS01064808.1:720-1268(+)